MNLRKEVKSFGRVSKCFLFIVQENAFNEVLMWKQSSILGVLRAMPPFLRAAHDLSIF
jgi:hypothetical protein